MLREKLAAEVGGLERCVSGIEIPDRHNIEQKSYEVKLGFVNGKSNPLTPNPLSHRWRGGFKMVVAGVAEGRYTDRPLREG
jgi:hypothetical protein